MASQFYPPSASPNPADDADNYAQGYPRLAYFFSLCPRYLHLRRFTGLSTRLLLYRQHELVILEKKLLKLEKEISHDEESEVYNKDYGRVAKGKNEGKAKELVDMYEEIRGLLREFEKDVIRFDILGSRGYDATKLDHVQRWLFGPSTCNHELSGADGEIWGTGTNNPAKDIIQIVLEPEASLVEKLLRGDLFSKAHRSPRWLQRFIFWSNSQPDRFDQHNHSFSAVKHVALALGNITTSFLVYMAITWLYFFTGKVFNWVTTIVIALVITLSSIIFKNQQFVGMLATVCAVLVTLLANNDGGKN